MTNKIHEGWRRFLKEDIDINDPRASKRSSEQQKVRNFLSVLYRDFGEEVTSTALSTARAALIDNLGGPDALKAFKEDWDNKITYTGAYNEATGLDLSQSFARASLTQLAKYMEGGKVTSETLPEAMKRAMRHVASQKDRWAETIPAAIAKAEDKLRKLGKMPPKEEETSPRTTLSGETPEDIFDTGADTGSKTQVEIPSKASDTEADTIKKVVRRKPTSDSSKTTKFVKK